MDARALALVLTVFLGGCSGDMLANGCPSLSQPLAMPGDPPNGGTYQQLAVPFFQSYCTRCHGSQVTGAARNGAPDGLNWDVESTVRANLSSIRSVVGVTNFMPPSAPTPICDERERMARWIDLGAP